jgi:hypothetical protein
MACLVRSMKVAPVAPFSRHRFLCLLARDTPPSSSMSRSTQGLKRHTLGRPWWTYGPLAEMEGNFCLRLCLCHQQPPPHRFCHFCVDRVGHIVWLPL